MANLTCKDCDRELVKINGRTLRAAINSGGAAFENPFRPTEWVSICPACTFNAFGVNSSNLYPFLCCDGVMRVLTDFECINCGPSNKLSFAGFEFSRAALNAAVNLVRAIDSSTGEVEKLAQQFLASPSSKRAFAFSRRVCEWGRGHRVWGNLNRFHTKRGLGQLICNWLTQTPLLSPRESISIGKGIKGLGVSFASKHLRLAFPNRFGVLDEVISEGLGLAMNEAGYDLFHMLLGEFQQQFAPEKTIAEIESGLFFLVRQGVRATR